MKKKTLTNKDSKGVETKERGENKKSSTNKKSKQKKGVKRRKTSSNKDSIEVEIKERNDEEDQMPKTYQSSKARIQCDAQGGIKSLLSQMNILPVPKPTLQANNKSYMISFQMFSH